MAKAGKEILLSCPSAKADGNLDKADDNQAEVDSNSAEVDYNYTKAN